eukprot:TRINITY_DN180_c0_g2_i1.p1 TRINITY_DN180_c0_g2~~TRINITY_DN180_c0_g2_i1.p1  ORF type:complete len:185 (-),score=53.49 TRINITY_DN180_c0_g2_i1:431-985(-)
MGNSVHSRILVLGIENAGKTAVLNKLQFPSQNIACTPTESYDIRDVKLKGVKFNVWDVSGKASTRSLWPSYYKEGGIDAVVWVVDSSAPDTLEESRKALETAMRAPELAGKILYVLANKQDVDGAVDVEHVRNALKLKQYQDKRELECVGVSAQTGQGLKEAMEDLAKRMKLHLKKAATEEKKT